MKKIIAVGIAVLAAIIFSSVGMAKSNPAITVAPSNFAGSVAGDILTLSWDQLLDTSPSNLPLTEYSIDIEIYSSLTASCPADIFIEASYSVDPSDVLFCDAESCLLNVDLTTLVPTGYTVMAVTAKVKGLATAGGKGKTKLASTYSQNNAAAMTEVIVTPCP